MRLSQLRSDCRRTTLTAIATARRSAAVSNRHHRGGVEGSSGHIQAANSRSEIVSAQWLQGSGLSRGHSHRSDTGRFQECIVTRYHRELARLPTYHSPHFPSQPHCLYPPSQHIQYTVQYTQPEGNSEVGTVYIGCISGLYTLMWSLHTSKSKRRLRSSGSSSSTRGKRSLRRTRKRRKRR